MSIIIALICNYLIGLFIGFMIARNLARGPLLDLKNSVRELLPYAEDKLKQNNMWCKDKSPDEVFYGEDIVTYPIVMRAKRALEV